MKRFAVLALAGALLISISSLARIDTSLGVVPHDAIGLIYAQSLKDLNQEISDLMSKMNPALLTKMLLLVYYLIYLKVDSKVSQIWKDMDLI